MTYAVKKFQGNIINLTSLISSTQAGPRVTAWGAANVKGSWRELVASTDENISFLIISAQEVYGDNKPILLDIGIGPSGSEQVIFNNLRLIKRGSAGSGCYTYVLPCNIPAGARIAGRSQSDGGGGRINCGISAIYGGGDLGAVLQTIGADTATSLGTLVASGASANLKSSWVELIPETSHDIENIVMHVDHGQNQDVSSAFYLMDIAIGPSGSEVAVIENMSFSSGAVDDILTPALTPMPVQIPAGSRVSVRQQSSLGNVSGTNLYVILYGY